MSTSTPKVWDIQSVPKSAADHDARAAALVEAGYQHYDASSEHDSYRLDASKLPAASAVADQAPKKSR